jgi:hypothetical protein
MADKNILQKYPIKTDDVVYKEIESKSVLLNLNNGYYYTLNQTGTFLWSRIDGKTMVSELISQITQNYEVTLKEATEDVISLLMDLKNENLIDLNEKPKSS